MCVCSYIYDIQAHTHAHVLRHIGQPYAKSKQLLHIVFALASAFCASPPAPTKGQRQKWISENIFPSLCPSFASSSSSSSAQPPSRVKQNEQTESYREGKEATSRVEAAISLSFPSPLPLSRPVSLRILMAEMTFRVGGIERNISVEKSPLGI